MARRRLPYGPKATLDQALLLQAEVAIDLTESRLRIGNGVTPGGVATAKKSEVEALSDDVAFLDQQVAGAGTTKIVKLQSDLAGIAGPTVGTRAEVRKDPLGNVANGNGIYRYTGSAWEWIDHAIPMDVQQDIAAEATAAALAVVEPLAGLVGEAAPPSSNLNILAAVMDEQERMAPFMRTDGRLLQTTAAGEVEAVMTRAEAAASGGVTRAPMWKLIGGERPERIVLDPAGRIITVETLEGSTFAPGASGEFERLAGAMASSPPGVAPTYVASYLSQAYDWGRYATFHAPGPDVCLILLTMGQSNATGVNSTSDTLPGATPVYSGNALMLAGGSPRQNGLVPITGTADLAEAAVGGERETAASAIATHLIRDLEGATGRRVKTLSAVCGLGARPYRGLSRGSEPYNAMLATVRSMVAICRQRGWTPICPGIDWMQGESDAGGPNMNDGRTSSLPASDYVRGMRQFSRQVSADIRAITGQAEDVVLIISQLARSSPETAPSIWTQSSREAQRELHGQGNIRVAGPNYQFDFTPDGLHLTSAGQNARGQRVSKALVRECFGNGWSPVVDRAHRWNSATQIDIEFEVPTLPLVIDNSGDVVATTEITTTKGFHFTDGTGSPPAITGVALVDDRTVRITLAAPPAGHGSCRVGYALKRVTGSTVDGRLTGQRGLVRDSNAHSSAYGLPNQANWALSFIREVGRP